MTERRKGDGLRSNLGQVATATRAFLGAMTAGAASLLLPSSDARAVQSAAVAHATTAHEANEISTSHARRVAK